MYAVHSAPHTYMHVHHNTNHLWRRGVSAVVSGPIKGQISNNYISTAAAWGYSSHSLRTEVSVTVGSQGQDRTTTEVMAWATSLWIHTIAIYKLIQLFLYPKKLQNSFQVPICISMKIEAKIIKTMKTFKTKDQTAINMFVSILKCYINFCWDCPSASVFCFCLNICTLYFSEIASSLFRHLKLIND